METFAIVPNTSRAPWILVAVVLVILIIVGVLMVATARGSRSARFEVSNAGLRLHGDLWGRLVPAADLRGGAARIVDLAQVPDLALRRRTMGTAMPGYRAGWFRLANGEKALVYLTNAHRAVYVPTNRGFSLLLSPQRPERFVESLRSVAPTP